MDPDLSRDIVLPILAVPLIRAIIKEPRGIMESLRASKAVHYMCGLSVVIVGPGLYSYYVRELLAFLLLFAGAFLVLLLAALGIYLLWCAVVMIATWTPPASRSVVAFSRRFIGAYAKS